jgi:hypothetical protein
MRMSIFGIPKKGAIHRTIVNRTVPARPAMVVPIPFMVPSIDQLVYV